MGKCFLFCESNLENYFSTAIIHLSSPQVQSQDLPVLWQAREDTTKDKLQKKMALALFSMYSFRRQLQCGVGEVMRRGDEGE